MLFRYLVNSDTMWRYERCGEEGTREGNVRLCKMGIQTGFLYTRYLIMREIGLEKQKIRWEIRARRFEEKVKGLENENSWVKVLERKRKKGLERSIWSRERKILQ